jgi:hypothetical protein
MLATGFPVPRRAKNSELLKTVADCGVFTMFPEHDPAEVLATHVDEWVAKAKAGNLGDVFRSIDELPSWMDDHKSFIKLQVADMALPGPYTVAMVKQVVASRDHLDPFARIKLARAARRGGEFELAQHILRPAVPELNTQEELEVGLLTAAGDDKLQELIAARLSSLFPQSRNLLAYRLKELADEREYPAMIALLSSTLEPARSQIGGFFERMARGLSVTGTPSYEQLVAEAVQAEPDREAAARVLCSSEALARGDYANALSVLLPKPGELLTATTAHTLMRVCFRLLLERGKDGELTLSGDALRYAVVAIVNYLAANPTDPQTRIRLAELLGIETAGVLGLSVIVSIILDDASGVEVTQTAKRSEPSKPPQGWDLSEFLKRAFEWMAEQSPFIPHMASLPKDLLQADPNFVFDEVQELLRHDQDLRDGPSAETYEQFAQIGALVAALTDRPHEDIDIIRYAAARFVAANRPQKARDLAEQALFSVGADLQRRRLGWLAFADVYHRCQNRIESLIALACMFAVKVSITVEDLWQEGFLLFRVFRDLSLIDPARAVVEMLRGTLPKTESPEGYRRRLATMEIGIEMAALRLDEASDDSQLRTLTKQAADHCEDVITHGDDPSPALSLLVHCLQLAKFHGYPVDEAASRVLKQGKVGAPASLVDLLTAVSDPTPDARQLITLLETLEMARYHQDTAFDVNHIGIAARRLLDIPLGNENAISAIIAIEAGADHGIRRQKEGVGPWFVSRVSLQATVHAIATLGFQLVFMGLSETGQLVRVHADADGSLHLVAEDRAIFSGAGFHQWTLKYPHQYPFSKEADVFLKSTASMQTTFQPTKPIMLVLDTRLQQLPPNLFRVGDRFFGMLVPVSSMPSLSWMANQKDIPRGTPGKLRAWIPSTSSATGDKVLNYLVGELEAPLIAAGVVLSRDAALPEDLEGCELAILAAHGGVLPKGEYFQVISDNASLSIYPEVLASSVKASRVVVLFMCSGGRVDSHPHAQTTVGLVKQLFDHGCATIIACPWPLDASVAAKWAPVFLRRWNDGATAAEAAFDANTEVAHLFGGDPVNCLAMNVYGDMFQTKHGTQGASS